MILSGTEYDKRLETFSTDTLRLIAILGLNNDTIKLCHQITTNSELSPDEVNTALMDLLKEYIYKSKTVFEMLLRNLGMREDVAEYIARNLIDRQNCMAELLLYIKEHITKTDKEFGYSIVEKDVLRKAVGLIEG